jgi:hypothetical protein
MGLCRFMTGIVLARSFYFCLTSQTSNIPTYQVWFGQQCKGATASIDLPSADDAFASADAPAANLARNVSILDSAASPDHQRRGGDDAPSAAALVDDSTERGAGAVDSFALAPGAIDGAQGPAEDTGERPGSSAGLGGGMPQNPADTQGGLCCEEEGGSEDVAGGIAGRPDESADMEIDPVLASLHDKDGHVGGAVPHAEGHSMEGQEKREGSAEAVSKDPGTSLSFGTGYGPYVTVPVELEQSEESVGLEKTVQEGDVAAATSHRLPAPMLGRLPAGDTEGEESDMDTSPDGGGVGRLGSGVDEAASDGAAGERVRLGIRPSIAKTPDADIPLPKKAPRAAAKNAAFAWASVCPPSKPEAPPKPSRKEPEGSDPVFVLPKHSQAAKFADMSGAITQPWILETAETSKVIWARVKGFPFWPVCLSCANLSGDRK